MRNTAIQSALILVFFFFASACSGKLTGRVFLDENGDESHDNGEPYLANLSFTVTKDGSIFAEGETDSDGKFSVSIKEGANYCVQVDDNDLSSADIVLVSGLVRNQPVKAAPEVLIRSQSITTETDCDDSIDNDSDEDVDCADADCDADAACEDDEDTEDDSDDDDTTGDEVREPGRSCKESTSTSVRLTVPVGIDYTVDDLTAEDPERATVGSDDVIVRLRYPNACTFNPFTLPEGIEPTDQYTLAAYNETRRRINFNEAIAAALDDNPDFLNTQESENFAEDDISTYEFTVSVDEDLFGTEEVEIQPTMECPDGSTVELKVFTIEVDTDNIFLVTNNLTSGTVAEGNQIQVTTSVVNTTGASYEADEVELVFTASSTASFTLPADAGCTPPGTTVTCEFALPANNSSTPETFVTTIDLPQVNNDSVTVTLSTVLTIRSGGQTLEVTGSAFERTLAP